MSLQNYKRPRLIDKISAKEAVRLSAQEAQEAEEIKAEAVKEEEVKEELGAKETPKVGKIKKNKKSKQ